MVSSFSISGRPIGPGHAPYVVAELSGNHNGELARALRLVEAASEAGADAVKLQTYRADTITLDHDGPGFVLQAGAWAGRRLYELYEEAHTPWEWHEPLFERARSLGMEIFSAPFDASAVDFLEGLDCPAYKIASPEIVDLPLIERVARTGKPMILSTGMASLVEIEEAVAAARGAGASELCVLHCISGYPTPPEEAGLATINDMAQRFGLPIGLSDHSMDTLVATVAVGLGASLVEKHLTWSRDEGGVDSVFSLEPAEFRRLVVDVATAHRALGEASYALTESEQASLASRRSLYVVSDVKRGESLTATNIRSIRPNLGMAPKLLPAVLGYRAARDLKRGEPLAIDMIDGFED